MRRRHARGGNPLEEALLDELYDHEIAHHHRREREEERCRERAEPEIVSER